MELDKIRMLEAKCTELENDKNNLKLTIAKEKKDFVDGEVKGEPKESKIFDIVYNISDKLKDIDPKLESKLKERAFYGKKTYSNKDLPLEVRTKAFSDLFIEIDQMFTKALALLKENISSKKINGAEKDNPLATPTNKKPNTLENEEKVLASVNQEKEPEPIVKEQKRGWFGKKSDSKAKGPQVGQVSKEDLEKEMNALSGNTNDDYYNSQEFKDYMKKKKESAKDNEKDYESSGMTQERVMERPSYTPSSSNKK